VVGGDVVDELHDNHGLPHTGAAEQPDLAALGVGGQEVHDLARGKARGGPVEKPGGAKERKCLGGKQQRVRGMKAKRAPAPRQWTTHCRAGGLSTASGVARDEHFFLNISYIHGKPRRTGKWDKAEEQASPSAPG